MSQNYYTNIIKTQVPGYERNFSFGDVKPLDINLVAIMNRCVSSIDNETIKYIITSITDSKRNVGLLNFMQVHPFQTISIIL